jgi:tRNA dimethylallyltransferase
MSKLPRIITIVGPTASGKSSLAIKLAKEFDGEIIAADSRTIYKGMDIGTAKPEGQWLRAAHRPSGLSIEAMVSEAPLMVEGIAHWGIDLIEPGETYSAADFKAYAEGKIDDILSRGKLPILAGGTGLYVAAVVHNYQFADAEPDEQLRSELEELSVEQLAERLRATNPGALENVDAGNPQRLIRAIEIAEAESAGVREAEPEYDVLQIGLDWPREELYERINERVEQMIAEGLVDEVRTLRDKYGSDHYAMTGIGYRQLNEFFDGKVKLFDAVEDIKKATRHYAKRQLTWFRRDKSIRWVSSANEALSITKNFLAK